MNDPRETEWVELPVMFLQAGFPLKVSVYLSSAARRKVSLYRKKGEVIDLTEMLYLSKLPPARLLTTWEDYEEAFEYYRSQKDPMFEQLYETLHIQSRRRRNRVLG